MLPSDIYADCIRSADDLRENQRAAVDFLYDTPYAGLYFDVGEGKTVTIYTLLDRLFAEGYRNKVLVIAPIRVAMRVWPFEPRLWRHLAYIKPTVLRVDDDDPRIKEAYAKGYKRAREKGYGPAMASRIAARTETQKRQSLRLALLDDPARVHVINQEAVPWLVDTCVARKKWPYRIVVFDEASRLRDHKSLVFLKLRYMLPVIDRLYELTATPATQTYMNYFAQIYLLDQGKRFGKRITDFREQYFDYNKYTREYTLKPGAAEEIERLIADIVLVSRKEKTFITNVRPVRLPADVMEAYRDFEKTSILEIPEKESIDAINGAALSGKLLQLASGAVYRYRGENAEESRRAMTKAVYRFANGERWDAEDIEKRVFHVFHDEKIDELRELVEETAGEPLLVGYWFKSSLTRLREAFPDAAVMDREGKQEVPWNKRKFKMMLVHPQSVGHGLNLQFGGHHVVLFDIFWPLELYLQLVGRLDRPGQTKTVMVHLLSAVGTLDEVVAENLERLEDAQEAMFRRLRELHRKLRGNGHA